MAKPWLFRCIKKPLLKVIIDKSLNLDFTNESVIEEVRELRLSRAKMTIRSIFKNILEKVDQIPTPLI